MLFHKALDVVKGQYIQLLYVENFMQILIQGLFISKQYLCEANNFYNS